MTVSLAPDLFWKRLALVKPEPFRSHHYMAWIRTWPCVVCGSPETEAAHTGPHAKGSKASDFRCIPLCHYHHQSDSTGLDKIGPGFFEETYNLDIKLIVLQLIEVYLSQGNKLEKEAG